jgi:hypothetical protein
MNCLKKTFIALERQESVEIEYCITAKISLSQCQDWRLFKGHWHEFDGNGCGQKARKL